MGTKWTKERKDRYSATMMRKREERANHSPQSNDAVPLMVNMLTDAYRQGYKDGRKDERET